eukprot:6463676-Amphidinium_carterae.1
MMPNPPHIRYHCTSSVAGDMFSILQWGSSRMWPCAESPEDVSATQHEVGEANVAISCALLKLDVLQSNPVQPLRSLGHSQDEVAVDVMMDCVFPSPLCCCLWQQ